MTKRSTTPSRSQRAAIYRSAARELERGEELFSCMSLRHSGGRKLIPQYIDTMRVPKGMAGWADDEKECEEIRLQVGYYEAARDNGGSSDDAHCCDMRVLALCFMAAMVEAGDA